MRWRPESSIPLNVATVAEIFSSRNSTKAKVEVELPPVRICALSTGGPGAGSYPSHASIIIENSCRSMGSVTRPVGRLPT